jgi:hypothetical protein
VRIIVAADRLRDARNKTSIYEHQEEIEQKVRGWGDTAVVTALLWIKGTSADQPFERKLWFSDTYVRTAKGWRYVLARRRWLCHRKTRTSVAILERSEAVPCDRLLGGGEA